MNILIACEESQTECKAFRALGHNAFSCDLRPCSGGHPEWHIQGDALDQLHYHWDLLIAHPPCTYLSRVSSPWLFPNGSLDLSRYYKGLAARCFFYQFMNHRVSHIPKICIENPVPLKIFGLPPPSQVIQLYYFGSPFMKKTFLWLKGLPPLFSTLLVEDPTSFVLGHSSSYQRSKSFPEIADAMAYQWS